MLSASLDATLSAKGANMKVVHLGRKAWFDYRDRLVAARDRTSTDDERSALFDELAERFGHNSLAESLKDFGLR